MNKDELETIAKATAEIIKKVPVYKDTVQPVAKELGKALKTIGGVINVALAPFAAMVYGYDLIKEQLKNKLEIRLAKTSPENIVTPPLQIVGPLLDKYRYVYQNEELSDMFINLLANAMDKDRVKKAHPSFINIISEMSPDEAKLIKAIANEKVLPKIDIKIDHSTEEEKNKGYTYLFTNFTILGEKAKLEYSDLTPSYLSNLERLNIIKCPVGKFGSSYTNKTYYKELEENKFVSLVREQCEKIGKKVEIEQRTITITDFGKLFMDAVLAQD